MFNQNLFLQRRYLMTGCFVGLLLVPAIAHAQTSEETTKAAPPETTTPASETPPTEEKPEPARHKKWRIPRIGPEYGTFVPVSSWTRDRFGASWGGFGFNWGSLEKFSNRGTLTGEVDFFYSKKEDNRALLVPMGLQYQQAIGKPFNDIQPYYRASINVFGTQLKAEEDGIHKGVRFAYGGSVASGFNFGTSAFLEVRYRTMTEVRGIDLSGTEFRAGVRF